MSQKEDIQDAIEFISFINNELDNETVASLYYMSLCDVADLLNEAGDDTYDYTDIHNKNIAEIKGYIDDGIINTTIQ